MPDIIFPPGQNTNGIPTAGGDIAGWNPLFAAFGNSLIIWGTEGIFSQSLIVTSCNQSKRIEEIAIEQGAGFESIILLLMKGFDVDVTVVDDTSVQPVSIMASYLWLTRFGPVNMILVGDKTDQARKREGMRTYTFRSYSAIPNPGNTQPIP